MVVAPGWGRRDCFLDGVLVRQDENRPGDELYDNVGVLKQLSCTFKITSDAKFHVKTRSPSPFAWRPDFPGAPREAH